MADEFVDWMNKLHGDVDDNLKPAIKAIVENEKASNYLKSAFMAHSDYTKKTTELAKVRGEVDETATKLKTWFAAEQPKNAKLIADLAEKDSKLAKYEEKLKKFLDVDSPATPASNPPSMDTSKLASKDEVTELAKTLKTFDQTALRFNLDLADLMDRRAKEGFTDVDVRKVYAFSAQNGVNLLDAYESLTADARQKKSDEAFAVKLKEAEERGARTALSKHNLPDSTGRDTAPSGAMYREGISDPAKRRAAALEVFLDSGKKA